MTVRKPTAQKTASRAKKAKGSMVVRANAASKKPGRSTGSTQLVSPASAKTSDINYYGGNAKARNAAYSQVMAFIAEANEKHAGG